MNYDKEAKKIIDLLKANMKFYKANLHCYTTLSDGEMSSEEIKEYYLKNGCEGGDILVRKTIDEINKMF